MRGSNTLSRATSSYLLAYEQHRERDHERQHGRHPEGVEIGKRSRLLLTQVFELPHRQLLRGGWIAGLLDEERLSTREKVACGGAERIKMLAEPQGVKLIAPLFEGLGQRHPDAAPLVAQEAQHADGRPAQRERRIEVGGDVRRSKTDRKSHDQDHPRPDRLAWADVEVELRHPVVSRRHEQKARSDQPSRIHLEADQAADDRHREDSEDSGRRHHQPGLQRVIAEQGLQQTKQRLGAGKERKVSAKDDDAAGRKVAFVQRAEIDHGVAVTQLPEDQRNQTHHQ